MNTHLVEEISTKQYNTYTLDEHILLMFDPQIKHETYKCQWYHGIIFYISGEANMIFDFKYGKYDVIHNIYLGNRILINNHEGWKDIPFKKATFGFLPPGVEAIEI